MTLKLNAINKSFDNKLVLDNLDLDIVKGEFHTLLGPSGVGKSVLLRIIAGLTRQDSGNISFSGNDLSNISTERRPIGYVFQDFALFPNMNVEDNISFGLYAQGKREKEVKCKTDYYVELMGLEDLRKRIPTELSGGEKQRVAIARSLVLNPEIMLFDEPLSHLDKSLHQQLIIELRSIHHKTGVTCLYVTHNREEAMNLADRVSVLHKGQVVQTGTPEEIYYRPKTKFVAKFVGASNVIDVTVSENSADRTKLKIDGDEYSYPIELDLKYFPIFSKRKELAICLHPEKLRLLTEPSGLNCIPVTIKNMYLMDAVMHLTVISDSGLNLKLKVPRSEFEISSNQFFVEINDESFYPVCGRCKKDIPISECCEYYVPELKPRFAKGY